MDDRRSAGCLRMVASPCWRRYASLALLLLALVGWLSEGAEACSCLLEHPQQHYCSAHYVITARIRGIKNDKFNNFYRVKVNKVFKASEKAILLLGDKEIVSANNEGVCGVELEKGKTYLLAGRVIENKLLISICDFVSEWSSLSVKQKKGFKLLYKQGCTCQVTSCPWWNRVNCLNSRSAESQCAWDTVRDKEYGGELDCQGRESVCMRQAHGRCGWNGSTKYRHCLKLRKEKKERLRAMEP